MVTGSPRSRFRTIARAMRREWRSSPYSKMIRAISTSERRPSISAAVSSPPDLSMRISSGASCRKLNPREGESNCHDETPKSARIPRACLIFAIARTRVSSRKSACTARKRWPYSANRSLANSSASSSRSIASTCASEDACRIASLCPPRPTVQSTNNPPRSAASNSIVSRSSTGRWGAPLPPKGTAITTAP